MGNSGPKGDHDRTNQDSVELGQTIGYLGTDRNTWTSFFCVLFEKKNAIRDSTAQKLTLHYLHCMYTVYDVFTAYKGWLAIAKLKPLSLFISPFYQYQELS